MTNTDGICTTWLHWFTQGDNNPCQCGEFDNAAELIQQNTLDNRPAHPLPSKPLPTRTV